MRYTSSRTMQEASARLCRGAYLPLREGHPLLPKRHRFLPCGVLCRVMQIWTHRGVRMPVLEAALLLALPLLLTFAKLLELPPLAESNHQLQRYL